MTKPAVIDKIRAIKASDKTGTVLEQVVDCLNGIADEIEGVTAQEEAPAAAPTPTPDAQTIAALQAKIAELEAKLKPAA